MPAGARLFELLTMVSPGYLSWALVTPFVVWFGRALLPGRYGWGRTLISLFFLGLAAVITQAVLHQGLLAAWGLSPGHDLSPGHMIPVHVLEPLPSLYFVYLAIIGTVFAVDYYRRYRDQDTTINQLQQKLLEAQSPTADVSDAQDEIFGNGAALSDRFVVKENGESLIIKTDDIDYIQGEGVYVRLHTGDRSYLVRERLTDLETRLKTRRFCRIHRSTIVNLDRIEKLSPHFHGDYLVVLRDGTQLKLSRRRRDYLKSLLGSDL